MGRTSNLYASILGQVKRETEKAILITLHAPKHPEHNKDIWFPLSQIISIHHCYDLDKGTFDVLMASEWILGQKGLISASEVHNPALTDPRYVANCEKIPANTENNAPKLPPNLQGRSDYNKMKHNRLPYKDDEDPVINDDEIPF